MTRILLAAVATLFLSIGAIAHQAAPVPSMDVKAMEMNMAPSPGDSEATKGYKASMVKMMQTMPKYVGDADIDFMKQMRSHHQAAIDMAKVLLATGKDTETRKLAEEIIAAQEKEIATIDAWLKKMGA